MLKVRTSKTSSGSTAVQVVFYTTHKVNVVKHIGSGKTNQEIEDLKTLGYQYIEQHILEPGQTSFFEERSLISIDNISIKDSFHTFAYEFLSCTYDVNGFNSIGDNLLRDLAIMRIIDPVSKEESIDLMREYFNIKYSYATLHRGLQKIVDSKSDIESVAVEYARANLNFDFSLVFYDVTNLYFESFKSDEFRKPGYNKEGKSQQPQIAIGLVVNKDGYPISIDIFEGNKFEGHTFIPVILNLKKKYNIKTLTVVADAAMLSFSNMKDLEDNGLSFIVGARLSKVDKDILQSITDKLNKKEGKYIRTDTKYGTLICDYSLKRAQKDKSDRLKQIRKAEYHIQYPSKNRRPRFVKKIGKEEFEINKELIEYDELKEGIKGYYTNLSDISPQLIVSRYHDLWHVEKSFRITKSDLKARPIYHRK
jgi:transposase